MTDIFVSYAREDRDRVAKLVETFEARGWSVWWDSTIAVGSDYSEAIEEALREARCVVVVWSGNSIGSHWVREEAAMGRSRGTLVPVRIDDVSPPIGFRSIQTSDLRDWSGASSAEFDRLLGDLEGLLSGGASDDVAAVRTVRSSSTSRPVSRRSAMTIGGLLLTAVVLVAALWLNNGRQSSRESSVPLVEQETSIAVLPFENLTGNEHLSYLGPGLAAGVVSELSALPDINVVSKSRAWSQLESARSLTGLAEALGVGLLVEGEVYASDGGLRVDVSVVDGASSRVLWSEGFAGDSQGLYQIQQDIVTSMARLVSAPLSAQDRQRIVRGGPSARAFDFYLQGLERIDQAGNPRSAVFAADLFRQAILIDGDIAVFHSALSDAIWAQHLEGLDEADLAEAEREATTALELDPQLPMAHLALARSIRGQGQFAESIATLRPVLARHPKPDEAYRELGHGYEQAGDTKLAAECFEAATVLGPENWFNWNDKGVFLARQWDLDAARESFEKAVGLAPASVRWPHINLAAVRVLLEDYAGAIADYEATGIETSDPDLASNLGTAYFFEGQLEEAVALYRRAVDLDPDDHVNRRNLGDALQATGRMPEAREEFGVALELVEKDLVEVPRNNELLSSRALYGAKKGDCEAALEHADELRSLLAESFQEHLDLAMTFSLCSRHDDALAEIEVCLQMGYPGSALLAQPEFAALAENREFLELVGDDD